MISDIPQTIIYRNLFLSDKYYPLPKIGSEYIFAPRHTLYIVYLVLFTDPKGIYDSFLTKSVI